LTDQFAENLDFDAGVFKQSYFTLPQHNQFAIAAPQAMICAQQSFFSQMLDDNSRSRIGG
jgi:hypothetical protein